MTTNDDDLGRVKRLRGVTWEWREGIGDKFRDAPGMGVIAQELEQVFPELVQTGEDGIKRVNYLGLIAPLIEAVKELDARVAALEQAARDGTSPTGV